MNRLLPSLLVPCLALGLAGCPKPDTPPPPPIGEQEKAEAEPNPLEGIDLSQVKGLLLFLSEADAAAAKRVVAPPAKATRLSDAETKRVLDRLPPLTVKLSDQKEFAFRERSLKPPRTGQTVKGAFPPAGGTVAPEKPEPAPLEVRRKQPEGEVSIAPHLSVTFTQPMVPVTSHDDLAKDAVPVKLTPEPPGSWRWIGTKTLLFEPKPRFPMATEYRVEVPAGTKSMDGGVLKEAVTWEFKTPPPKVVDSYPGRRRSAPLNQPVFIAFDQRIDPEAVYQRVTLMVDRGPIESVRMDEAELKARLPELLERASRAGEGRWLALRPKEPLPKDKSVYVKIGPKIPSLEGPRVSTKTHSFRFRTYAPLRVSRYRCSWRDKCPPGATLSIEFNNALDEEVFDPQMVTVTPEIPGMEVGGGGGSWVYVRGRTRGRTTYTVRLNPEIQDEHGQLLGDSQPLKFEFGSADPWVTAPGGDFVVLEPSEDPRWSVFSINHKKLKVALYEVGPEDYQSWLKYLREYRYWRYERKKIPKPPGKRVFRKTIKIASQPDVLVETPIELSRALTEGLGHVVAVVEPTKQPPKDYGHIRVHAWVQSTRIGLDAFVDSTELVAWASSLADGKPLAGVELSIAGAEARSSNDAGLATLALPDKRPQGTGLLVARSGNDVALLPESTSYWSDSTHWHDRKRGTSLAWYVVDDRQMYKPKEEVHLKGWVRVIDFGEGGDVGAYRGGSRTVTWRAFDPRSNEIAKGEATLNRMGGFHLKFSLPDAANLGRARVELYGGGHSSHSNSNKTHYFQIQEFRRPEYEVTARTETEGPHVVGGHVVAAVTASYYTGGGLPNAQVAWNVSAQAGHYRPPNRDAFTFGTWVPWWEGSSGSGGGLRKHIAGVTDAAGSHRVKVAFPAMNPPRAMTVRAQAGVTDVNRQTWYATTSWLVHPARHYVGLKTPRTFVEQGKPIHVDAIVVDLQGEAVSGRPIDVTAVRLKWARVKRRWKQVEVDTQKCDVTSTAATVRCTFKTPTGGRYRIRARIQDASGRPNESELTVWVSGGQRPPRRGVEGQKVELIPDRRSFQPGDTAEVLVQAPFSPAEGILTVRRSGILKTQRFSMKTASHTLRIPVEEAHIPNLHVDVELVGKAPRVGSSGEVDGTLPGRPAYATGQLLLRVPPERRVLSVSAEPRDTHLEPQGETVVDVVVKDAAGKPVAGAEVLLMVVDEAVLALSGYQLPDPMGVFYPQRGDGTDDYHLRKDVLLVDPNALAQLMQQAARSGKGRGRGFGRRRNGKSTKRKKKRPSSPKSEPAVDMPMEEAEKTRSGDEGKDGGGDSPIAVRADFDPLATFAPEVPTDANGRAQVKVKVRDNLTRYRVMAVAVDEARQFGSHESGITARLPLMVRPSAPRFLNFGDRFELPVVLQNQTDGAMSVDVAIAAGNAKLVEGAGRRVRVPANDRVEVRFPTTTEEAGTARFRIGAVAGRFADSADVELPVWTPATTEAFATYGTVDEGAMFQAVHAPSKVFNQFGGLEITTSSTALHALTDAFLYLVRYRFECSEQLSSRILAISALRDVLTAFQVPGMPDPKTLKRFVGRDIKRVLTRQAGNGGFAFWRPGQRPWPYVSIYVTHALTIAKKKGFKVPDYPLKRALGYLRSIERRFPSWYGPEIRRTLTAYALNVRLLNGDRDAERAAKLIEEAGGVDKLNLEALGWLYPVLSGDEKSTKALAEVRRAINNRVTETAAAAHFASSYSDGGYLILHSNRRADGILLDGLIGDQPESDLIPKIVRGLLGHRKRGRWSSTQDNAFVLLALDRYFQTYEKVTPDFVARVWLGDRYAGDHPFKGRTTERFQLDIPMRYVAEGGGKHQLAIQKDGAGRLYYRIGMTYAPRDLKLEPAEHGFTVLRSYEPVDDPGDVKRAEDGTWRIKAGAKVRVRLKMLAPTRRYHVALVDPLPAGLEPMNPALAVTGDVPADPKGGSSKGRYWWWSRPWFEHQNMRDERVEAFTSLLWGGVHTYTYVATATTPGRFVTPPTKAEEMYTPETFGRTASDVVVVY